MVSVEMMQMHPLVWHESVVTMPTLMLLPAVPA